jgi:isoamylase
MRQRYETRPGTAFPLGAKATPDGVNFSVFSRHATSISLVLYSSARSLRPLQVIELDAGIHRHRFLWHVFVVGLKPGIFYTWQVDGPHEPIAGHRFDAGLELVDPWAREVDDRLWQRGSPHRRHRSIRGRVTRADSYDWEGDAPFERPLADEVIYELHVGGFTRGRGAGTRSPGTFNGLVKRIPYLKSLGVTAVELLPVMAFDAQDVPPGVAGRGLSNFWGYSTYGFYALHPRYGARRDVRDEFRDLVKALHRAGIAVILDVVFNHTAEGGDGGPTINFRGLDNSVFYHLDPGDRSHYMNYTGCGNTVNCNHPIVINFIVECLEYWVTEMHVDGFRFDLASILTRDETGRPDFHAPVVWAIELSPILRSRWLIAEAWDAVGLHQVGGFPGFAWSEWNDRYRDTIRAFVRGDPGIIGEVATRLSGSSDLYAFSGKRPQHGINFVTCHDGFTLYDLVSYNEKHNVDNGESNADGHNNNLSWNSGAEGPSTDPRVVRLRLQRARNFVVLLLLSQGVPMINAGDERLRTQKGNNNAYCQDNELGWIDWTPTVAGEHMVRFVREMIALRRRHPTLRRQDFIDPAETPTPALIWYGADGHAPSWHDGDARVLCFRLLGVESSEPALCVLMNMSAEPHDLPLAESPGTGWKRVVDTALAPPEDIIAPGKSKLHKEPRYRLAARAIAVFESA